MLLSLSFSCFIDDACFILQYLPSLFYPIDPRKRTEVWNSINLRQFQFHFILLLFRQIFELYSSYCCYRKVTRCLRVGYQSLYKERNDLNNCKFARRIVVLYSSVICHEELPYVPRFKHHYLSRRFLIYTMMREAKWAIQLASGIMLMSHSFLTKHFVLWIQILTSFRRSTLQFW